MAWFGKRAVVAKAVEDTTVEMKVAVEVRKSARSRLLDVIDRIPLDTALSDLGRNLTEVKRDGH